MPTSQNCVCLNELFFSKNIIFKPFRTKIFWSKRNHARNNTIFYLKQNIFFENLSKILEWLHPIFKTVCARMGYFGEKATFCATGSIYSQIIYFNLFLFHDLKYTTSCVLFSFASMLLLFCFVCFFLVLCKFEWYLIFWILRDYIVHLILTASQVLGSSVFKRTISTEEW